jgi:hypothetical protein
MSVTRRDLARAEAMGRIAARGRCGIESCPYEANGSPDERVLAGRFVRAYVAAGGAVSVDYDDGESVRTQRVQLGGTPARVTLRRGRLAGKGE